MENNINIILTVIATVVTISSLCWAIYENIIQTKDKADIKASIRGWQHQAKGISLAIKRLTYSSKEDGDGTEVWSTFSNKKDIGIALDALHEISKSMAESLYESRFFSEDELKEILKKDSESQKNKDPQKNLS